MVRVIGIDPGTVSLDVCGLEGERVWLDQSFGTREVLAAPDTLIRLLKSTGRVDLIAGPSGYGLPLVGSRLTEPDIRLAYLAPEGETGGIGGLRRLAQALAQSRLPLVFTPGVIHLTTVPAYRKLNRVDLGTADKVAAAALGIWSQAHRLRISAAQASFILLELGGAFTALVAVDGGRIVDGIGGTSGPIGWRSSGAWDGEVAFLAERVDKELLFKGGAMGETDGTDLDQDAMEAYVEGALKAVLALTASVPRPREILLSGRHASEAAVRSRLEERLNPIAPLVELRGFATTAKAGAQGAALIADGLAGGHSRALVETMRIREAAGSALDHLRVISPDRARRRLGIA